MNAAGNSSINMRRPPAVIERTRVHSVLLMCGIASAVVWLGTDVLSAWRYAGYRYPFDPISGLSAVDSPVRPITVALSVIYLVLKVAFTFGAWASAGEQRNLRLVVGLLFAFCLSDLAAQFFPWRPEESVGSFFNLMHSIFAGGVSVLLILLIIGFGASAGGKWFRMYSYGTLLVMVVIGVIPLLSDIKLTTDQIPEWFGAGERINAYGFMLWLIGLAWVLLRYQSKNLQEKALKKSVETEVPGMEY